jgi:hypothetical protein
VSVSAAARYVATKTAPLMLLAHQEALTSGDLIGYADMTGARGTQTFFINGQRHEGRAELASLSAAIDATRFRTRRSTHALTADPGVEPQRQMVAA